MKDLKTISGGDNYAAIDLGAFANLMDHSFLHPKLNLEVKGKVFTGEALKATGTEISFQVLPARAEISFLHTHKTHEEIYVFLKGSGQFQVDGNIIDVKEGTVIRVSPEGKRAWRNNSDEPLTFMVIQSKSGSLEHFTVADGSRVEGKINWEK